MIQRKNHHSLKRQCTRLIGPPFFSWVILVSETQPPSHARYYKNVRKGGLGNGFTSVCTLLWNAGAVNYDVKLVVRVRRLVRAYTLVEIGWRIQAQALRELLKERRRSWHSSFS